MPLAGLLAFVSLLVAGVGVHASRRRVEAHALGPVRTLAARVVGPELAMFPASRWLRHPTRAEPWAAFSDGPAVLDIDPAGAIAPPPRALFAPYSERLHARRPR